MQFSRGASYKCDLLIVVISFVVSELSYRREPSWLSSYSVSLPIANFIATHQGFAKGCVWDRLKSDMQLSDHENQENPAIRITRIDDSFHHQRYNDRKIQLALVFLCHGVEAMVAISHQAVATLRSQTRLTPLLK
jgi:hypothetical protein